MKKHSYKISKDNSFVEIFQSRYYPMTKGAKSFLEIYYKSDTPKREDLFQFIEKEYPQLNIKNIDFIHESQSLWFSDWNCGKPTSPFMFFTVFFKS